MRNEQRTHASASADAEASSEEPTQTLKVAEIAHAAHERVRSRWQAS